MSSEPLSSPLLGRGDDVENVVVSKNTGRLNGDLGAGVIDDLPRRRIVISKSSSGLGFNIRGGVDAPYVKSDVGIFVVKVHRDGAAARDGRLRAGDKILSLNGAPLTSLRHEDAVALFLAAPESVTLDVVRGAGPVLRELEALATEVGVVSPLASPETEKTINNNSDNSNNNNSMDGLSPIASCKLFNEACPEPEDTASTEPIDGDAAHSSRVRVASEVKSVPQRRISSKKGAKDRRAETSGDGVDVSLEKLVELRSTTLSSPVSTISSPVDLEPSVDAIREDLSITDTDHPKDSEISLEEMSSSEANAIPARTPFTITKRSNEGQDDEDEDINVEEILLVVPGVNDHAIPNAVSLSSPSFRYEPSVDRSSGLPFSLDLRAKAQVFDGGADVENLGDESPLSADTSESLSMKTAEVPREIEMASMEVNGSFVDADESFSSSSSNRILGIFNDDIREKKRGLTSGSHGVSHRPERPAEKEERSSLPASTGPSTVRPYPSTSAKTTAGSDGSGEGEERLDDRLLKLTMALAALAGVCVAVAVARLRKVFK